MTTNLHDIVELRITPQEAATLQVLLKQEYGRLWGFPTKNQLAKAIPDDSHRKGRLEELDSYIEKKRVGAIKQIIPVETA